MKGTIKQILREGLISKEQQSPKPIRFKMDMPIPDDILGLSKIFKSYNFSLMIVGGAVRDSILNKPIKDYDLATDAVPDTVETMMEAAGFKTLPTGKSFGVINVFTDKGEYEIATFREDVFNEPTLDNFKTYLKSLNNGKYEEFLINLMK
jgi:tRNA nucleotidyltransferase/poly(A) polymerase